MLLDFIEAMNAGVVFARHYTVLKDRDITGELKEVWNAVLAIRDSEQRPPQQETWIDAQPSVPQYPQYPEQQQQEYTPQPPQYHSNIAYGRAISGEGMHYETYCHQSHSPIIPQNEIYQSGQLVPSQYHGNDPRIALDRYNYRERGRGGPIMPNMPQQSCPAYPTAQYQFQQLPRQMMPQYVNSSIHPNTNLTFGPAANSPPAINPPFQPYIPYQQQQQQQPQSPPPQPSPRMDNATHVDMRKMQQQQPQMHLNHVQPQYEQPRPFAVCLRTVGRPHMGVVQKSNATKRQVNSPTHNSCGNCQTKEDQSSTKPKSPVKVLQREIPIERQDMNNHAENNKPPVDKVEESKVAQTTNLDDDLKKSNEFEVDSTDILTKKKDDVNQEAAHTVDNLPPWEEKNSVKVDKPSPEIKEIEMSGTQQSTSQTKPKFSRRNIRTGKAPVNKADKHNSAFASESPKRSQPTMNSIIKSVFKIHPGASGEETSGKRKTNGQTRANAKTTCENEEVQQGYTILKKEVQEEMVSEIAQISIQDCKDTTDVVGPVLSR